MLGPLFMLGINTIMYSYIFYKSKLVPRPLAIVEKGAFISYDAVVTNGVRIVAHRFVPPGANIDTQEKADSLSRVPKDSEEFAIEVQRVNQEFPASYHLLLGNIVVLVDLRITSLFLHATFNDPAQVLFYSRHNTI